MRNFAQLCEKIAIGLTLLCLTACAMPSQIVTEKPVPILPPATLMQDCPVPQPIFRTNEELAIWAKEIYNALLACNLDKKALRDWAERVGVNHE